MRLIYSTQSQRDVKISDMGQFLTRSIRSYSKRQIAGLHLYPMIPVILEGGISRSVAKSI